MTPRQMGHRLTDQINTSIIDNHKVGKLAEGTFTFVGYAFIIILFLYAFGSMIFGALDFINKMIKK